MEKRKLVVVDDHQLVLDGIKRILCEYFDVRTATTTGTALKLIKEETPDLVMSDINRPVSGGFDLLNEMRADQNTSGIPFVFLTVMGAEIFEMKALQHGADGYLSKGDNTNYIIERISRLMDRVDVYKSVSIRSEGLRTLNVFISYAKEDVNIARKLWGKLESYGVNVWFDVEKLLPGQEWELEIKSAIEDADAVILCLSENSVTKRGYIQQELKMALDAAGTVPEGDVLVIPIRVGECKVPVSLKKWQWVRYEDECLDDRVLNVLSDIAGKVGALKPSRELVVDRAVGPTSEEN